jgi:6-phosphogluconolactonase (cycloisomerase 2 family)
VGFAFFNGFLSPIANPNSQGFLSGNGANPGSVAFSADGRFLVVTEKTNNDIDVFRVEPNGVLTPVKVNASAAPGAFAAAITRHNVAIVSETGSGGTTSGVSSYSIQSDGSLTTISADVASLGAANCWNAITPDNRFVYVSNSGSSTIAGFSISSNGTLTPIPGTIVGTNPSGSTNLDIAISSDGKFLYSVNSGTGTISTFGINADDGSLTNLGTVAGLPAGSSLNGIAAD